MILMNTLASTIPFNQVSTGAVSAMFPTLFTPAGFTFSIWGVIYWLLLVGAISYKTPIERKGLIVYLISVLFNISWLFAWHYLYIALSLFIIILMLVTLTYLITKGGFKGLFNIGISTYFAWIIIATIANTAIVLSTYNLAFFSNALLWLQIILGVGFVLCLCITKRLNNTAVPAVFTWAYFGILLNHVNPSTSHFLTVQIIITILVFLMVIAILIRKRHAL